MIPFARYRSIVADWPAFSAALARPLPTCIWTNTLRIGPAELAQHLVDDGLDFEPLGWYPGGFRLPPDFRPGRHWAYLAGLYHVQEEVSMLPVILLDPQPGERILDLTAAPGGKTAQMAVMMANSGTIIANDVDLQRMRAVRHTLERLGLVNVSTTAVNGTNYPGAAGFFDRVLVDAPCSCEGISRKDGRQAKPVSAEYATKKSGVQRALLRKAVQLCKPGGRIVYSTCTYAPEENEAVVGAILDEFGHDELHLAAARPTGFETSPGITGWSGHRFHPLLENSIRVWPDQNDTGGFFVAVLEKKTGTAGEASPPFQPAQPPSESNELVHRAVARFGISAERLAPFTIFQPGRRAVYLVNRDHHPTVRPQPDAVGMLFVKIRNRYPKLSTAASMLLGSDATRNFIDLEADQLRAFISRQPVALSDLQIRECDGRGYVLVRHRSFAIGVGVFHPRPAGGSLESMFPKGCRRITDYEGIFG